MKSTVVDESLSSFKPMYCSRENQASTRLSQQYEKSTSKNNIVLVPFQEIYKLHVLCMKTQKWFARTFVNLSGSMPKRLVFFVETIAIISEGRSTFVSLISVAHCNQQYRLLCPLQNFFMLCMSKVYGLSVDIIGLYYSNLFLS